MDRSLRHFKLLTPARTGEFAASVLEAKKENNQRQTSQFLHERIIYSFLAYRSRLKDGATIQTIAIETGLNNKTVNKKIKNLPCLVHETNGKWFANEPPQGWFNTWDKSDPQHWSDGLSYLTFTVPSRVKTEKTNKRFGISHAIVWAIIKSYTQSKDSTLQLSINFLVVLANCIDRKTVSSVLQDLQRLELISVENRGTRLYITRLPELDWHRQFFSMKPDNPQLDIVSNVALPTSNKYVYKDDGLDQFRKICEGLMTQSWAEKAIRAAVVLKMSVESFESTMTQRKLVSDENVRLGKCQFSNFGKFFVTKLEQQAEAELKAQRKYDEEQRIREMVKSPEYKANEKVKEEALRANVMDHCHLISEQSVLDRVQFDHKYQPVPAERILRKVRSYCRNKSNEGSSVDDTGLDEPVMRLALHKLQDFYKAETKATEQQLKQAINDSIKELIPLAKPPFEIEPSESFEHKNLQPA